MFHYLEWPQNLQTSAINLEKIKASDDNVQILIFLSIDFDSNCGLYKSQCEYLTPGYLDFLDRIVDIGCLDRWWFAEKALKDYDINPEEWDEKGAPTKPDDQLKHMW